MPNLYEQLIAIDPTIQGNVILAVKKINPSFSFINEKLIEDTWETRLGSSIPTASEIIKAWNELKTINVSKKQAIEDYNTALSRGFVSAPLPSLGNKTINMSVSIQSALLFHLRVGQVREGISQGAINEDSDYTEIYDINNNKITISVKDFLSIILPFAEAADKAYNLSKKI